MCSFVLLHSPLVGPRTWRPVADRLHALGHDVEVPSLLGVADAPAPFWPWLIAAARTAFSKQSPVVLVAHSNAGLFVPLLVAEHRQVVAALFVDAGLPAPTGATPAATPEIRAMLTAKSSAGLVPRWTDWWDDADTAALFPDPETRAAVTAELRSLPLDFFEQSIPVPTGWDRAVLCSYLCFSAAYEAAAADAGRRGWQVERIPGAHLHQLVDPEVVAERLVRMATDVLGQAH